jgi:hypothetical protein
MKRAFFLCLMAAMILILCSSCVIGTPLTPSATTALMTTAMDQTTAVTSAEATSQTVQTNGPCVMWMQYASEEEMITDLRNIRELGYSSFPEFALTSIRYYFRLKTLPDNSSLVNIRVDQSHIELTYVFTEAPPIGEDSKMLMFSWSRENDGAQWPSFDSTGNPSFGNNVLNNDYIFETVERTAHNEQGERDESLPSIPALHVITWQQWGTEFKVTAPLWFTEEDAAKYCVAESVRLD